MGKLGITFLLLVMQFVALSQSQQYKEGYLVHQANLNNDTRCVVQVNEKDATKVFTGNPWDEDSKCDLMVITLTEGSTFENGSFTIQFKESGAFIHEVFDDKIGLSSAEGTEFLAYIHPEEEEEEASKFKKCDCPGEPAEYVETGLANLLNESYHIHIRFHNGIGPRCLNDMYYYEEYAADDYGYLGIEFYYGLSVCVTDWWFVEANTTTTTTTEKDAATADAFLGNTTEKSNSDLAIGLSVGLILAAIACVGVVLLVVYLVKKKKKSQAVEADPYAPEEPEEAKEATADV